MRNLEAFEKLFLFLGKTPLPMVSLRILEVDLRVGVCHFDAAPTEFVILFGPGAIKIALLRSGVFAGVGGDKPCKGCITRRGERMQPLQGRRAFSPALPG